MARGRMLNRKVATSEKVAAYGDEYGPWALVFHHRLIAFLDVNGCCRADPYWLKAEIFPRVSGITPEDCRKFAAGLVKHGLAVLYEVAGMPYLHMPGFREEQVGLRVDRESPEVPVPEGFDPSSGKFPANFRKPSGYCPEVFPPEIEVEVEVEGEDITGAKAPEAAPRGEEASVVPLPRQATNEPPESGGDDAEDQKRVLARYRAEAVTIILDELWRSTRNRPPGRFGRDWSLDRELSIWRDLVKRYDPEEVNGAMRVMRRVGGFGDLEPLSLLLFRSREPQCRELFQRCLAFHRKQVEHEAAKRAGVIRVEVVRA